MNDEDLRRGEEWYRNHRTHVQGILAHQAVPAIEPSGSDRRHPELWKDIHWKWFLDNRDA